jgi:hypothetical protein
MKVQGEKLFNSNLTFLINSHTYQGNSTILGLKLILQ